MKVSGIFFGSVLACCLACSPQPFRWSEARPTGKAPAVSNQPARDGRWLLMPEDARADYIGVGPGGSRHLLIGGVRILEAADGSFQRSPDFIALGNVQVLDVPERLGGGYLFYAEHASETFLWRSKRWTSALIPLARITERAQPTLGFDRLYLQLSMSNRTAALDLETGTPIDLGPLPESSGFRSLAFADAWFGAAVSNVRGMLVTYDAGASWHGLDGLGNDAQLFVDTGTILVQSTNRWFRLTPEGRLEPQAMPEPETQNQEPTPPRAALTPLGKDPLRAAVLHGWPLSDAAALVVNAGAIGRVRLSDGALLEHRSNAYPGNHPCQGIALGTGQQDSGVGFVCSEPMRGTRIYQWSFPLELQLVKAFSDVRVVRPSGNGGLVVEGPCTYQPSPELADRTRHCVRSPDGQWREIELTGDSQVARVVVLDDGRIAVLIPPRPGAPGILKLIDGTNAKSVALTLPEDKTEQTLLSHGLWLNELRQTSPTSLGTWVLASREYFGVEVSLDGAVTQHTSAGKGQVARSVFHGSIALETTLRIFARVTTDYGKSWQAITPPPEFAPSDHRKNRSPRHVGCSWVGCVHGPWLLVGYPEEATETTPTTADTVSPPASNPQTPAQKPEITSERELVEAPTPQKVNLNPAAHVQWQVQCRLTASQGITARELAQALESTARDRPQRGVVSGFGAPALAGSLTSEHQSDLAFRELEGVPGPRIDGADLRWDAGNNQHPRFRAYVWGPQGPQWTSSAAWQIRVAPMFEQRIWGTAATLVPWADALQTAELFGTASRSLGSVDWSLELDPDETAGLLRINSPGSLQMHWIAQGRAIQSYGGLNTGWSQGAVLVRGEWYFGHHTGDEWRLMRFSSTGFQLLQSFPVDVSHRVDVVRTTDAERVGLLERTRYGNWYLYPLSDEFKPEAPLILTRKRLNAAPKACTNNDNGWWVHAGAPLSRFDGQLGSGIVTFEGPAEDWRARSLHAKVIVRDDDFCISRFAAELAERSEPSVKPGPSSPAVGEVPMILLGNARERRYELRCSL